MTKYLLIAYRTLLLVPLIAGVVLTAAAMALAHGPRKAGVLVDAMFNAVGDISLA